MENIPDLKKLSDKELLEMMEDCSVYTPYALGMEYLRRKKKVKTRKIKNPSDTLQYLFGYSKRKVEHFFVITLDGAHNVIKRMTISKGLVNRTLVHPREIYRNAIAQNACGIIIAHNHPSGQIEPSSEDIELTARIVQAGKIIGIECVDHIIFSKIDYYSFLEDGRM